MEKKTFEIDKDRLENMGVDPQRIVEYIEKMRAIHIKPIFIRTYFALKRDLVSS